MKCRIELIHTCPACKQTTTTIHIVDRRGITGSPYNQQQYCFTCRQVMIVGEPIHIVEEEEPPARDEEGEDDE